VPGAERMKQARAALGRSWALLKREVLPNHVAAAVIALTAGELSLTAGLHIAVDGTWRRRSCGERAGLGSSV
jgi:hypothetical protein